MLTRLSQLSLVPLWAGALWGSLHFHELDLHLRHGLCGPWGCGPPLEAAIGFHLFWLTVFLPPTIGLGLYFSRPRNRDVGRALLVVASILTIGVVGYDVIAHAIRSGTIQYVFRRGLLTLVTTVDVPMMQLVASGAVLRYYFGRESQPVAESELESESELLETQSHVASGA